MTKRQVGENITLFRTVAELKNCQEKIEPQSKLMFIGSCFTKNIGDRCANSCLTTAINPFGIVYNPISIANQIERLLECRLYDENDVHLHNGLYHTFDHHSSFSNQSKDEFLYNINKSLLFNADFIQQCDFLFITLGTAYAFYYNETTELVANCHKYPNKNFKHELISVDSIVVHYTKILDLLFLNLPNVKVVLSVSPIRHQRDGFRNNNISKATLLLATQEIQAKYSNVHYFEAYEIVLDELRDYRFFAQDMVHLNEVAIDYIWNKFANVFFADTTFSLVEKFERLLKDFNHRPFNSSSDEYLKFLKALDQQLSAFEADYPWPDITNLKFELVQRFNAF